MQTMRIIGVLLASMVTLGCFGNPPSLMYLPMGFGNGTDLAGNSLAEVYTVSYAKNTTYQPHPPNGTIFVLPDGVVQLAGSSGGTGSGLINQLGDYLSVLGDAARITFSQSGASCGPGSGCEKKALTLPGSQWIIDQLARDRIVWAAGVWKQEWTMQNQLPPFLRPLAPAFQSSLSVLPSDATGLPNQAAYNEYLRRNGVGIVNSVGVGYSAIMLLSASNETCFWEHSRTWCTQQAQNQIQQFLNGKDANCSADWNAIKEQTAYFYGGDASLAATETMQRWINSTKHIPGPATVTLSGVNSAFPSTATGKATAAANTINSLVNNGEYPFPTST